MITAGLALLMASTAQAVPTLTTDGACPGRALMELDDLTPGGPVQLLMSTLGTGDDHVAAGPCADTVTGIRGILTGPRFVATDLGRLRLTPTLREPLCGHTLQFLDLTTCELTRPVGLSDLETPDFGDPAACRGGAESVAVAPSGPMSICDDPSDVTCEQDFAALCPEGWHLCSLEEYQARNDGWMGSFPGGAPTTLGTIHCRGVGGRDGAGHQTFYTGDALDWDGASFNCHYGSSRDTCVTDYGCNEQSSAALCCAPSPLCGNGVTDGPEELCDDANDDETDECLSNCTWKNPTDHGRGC